MALTQVQIERLREIETIKAEAAEEARARSSQKMFEQMSSFLGGSGPSAGLCPNCYGEVRARWKFCPFCSQPSRLLCLFCGGRLPDEEGIRFCPDCGNRAASA